MKTYPRILSIILALLMLISCVACTAKGGTNTDNGGNSTDTTPGGDTGTTPGGDTGTTPGGDTGTTPGGDTNNPPAVDTREELSRDALIEKLTESIYTDNIKSSDFVGLTDPSKVGIIEEELDDVLYPVPADSEFAKIFNVAEYGISPENSGNDNSSALTELLKQVKNTEGLKKLMFPVGEYKFSKTITLKGINDLYFCSAAPSEKFTLIMTQWIQGIAVEDCKNLHFNDFYLDYETPSVVSGQIVSSTATSVVIKVDEGYDLTKSQYGKNANIAPLTTAGCSYIEYVWDEATDQYIPGNFVPTNILTNTDLKSSSYNAETRELTINFNPNGGFRQPKENYKVNVAYTMYQFFGTHISASENVYFESVHYYHTLGMALGAGRCINLYLNRFILSPKEGRLMSATADGLHTAACMGEVVVTNSVFECSHDDSFNIKGEYGLVSGNTPKVITFDKSKPILVEVGDVLEFYEGSSFKFLGAYTVTDVSEGKSTYKVKEAIKGDLSGAYIANATKINSLKVHNTYFGNKRNHAMLVQCQDVEISNCAFQNVFGGVIDIHSVADRFAEGIMPKNVTLKNCKFLHNLWINIFVNTYGKEGVTTPGTITGIHFENNFISESMDGTFDFCGAGDCSVQNNLIVNFYGAYKAPNPKNVICVSDSDNITISNNYIAGNTTNGNFVAIDVKDTATNVTVEGNEIDVTVIK